MGKSHDQAIKNGLSHFGRLDPMDTIVTTSRPKPKKQRRKIVKINKRPAS